MMVTREVKETDVDAWEDDPMGVQVWGVISDRQRSMLEKVRLGHYLAGMLDRLIVRLARGK